ncbi:MAG: hypothetical protein A2Y97_13650 [Nitrospirae bacterium RBG_13_39_12]|nr:MAG: hypothetical protein A2Y97_13650 [Nitrospirae bacterium RBG_13_39_12]
MKEMKIKISIEEIRDRIKPMFYDEGLQLVVLFGTVASGSIHKKSDIDLAFLFDKPVDILALTNRVIRLLKANDVDVIDLKRASPLLQLSVAKNGKLIYEKYQGNFNAFCSLAFRKYIDTRKLRDAQAKVIRNFLEVRGMV